MEYGSPQKMFIEFQLSLKEEKPSARDVAQWYTTCLACMRHEGEREGKKWNCKTYDQEQKYLLELFQRQL